MNIAGARSGEFDLIERCGHMLTMERPQQVNAVLLGWLDRHFPTGR